MKRIYLNDKDDKTNLNLCIQIDNGRGIEPF